MTLRLCLLMSALAVCLAGCATEPLAQIGGCDWVTPIRPSRQDQFSDGTSIQILRHNETGVRLCGW